MQEELKQAHRLAEMYREQCVTLETDLAQIREEGDMGREIFKVCGHESLHDMNNSD
jgi:coiled-coil domain-containing protein 77